MSITSLITSTFKEVVAPKMCCHCGKFFTFLCQDCYEQIAFGFTSENHQEYIEKITSLGHFSGPLKSLILSLKYQGQVEVAATLAKLTYYTTFIPNCDVLTSVPAHQERLDERGFNQSELIAKELALLLKKPYFPLLKRTKKIASQASVTDKNERKSRQQSTMSTIKFESEVTTEKTILLIDDVYTTGSTLNEAGRVLKQELKVSTVLGFTIAQA